MKTMKKLLAIFLAVLMLTALLPTVMADEETYTITITNSASGHTYEAYQVFSGKLSTDGKLTDIDWGTGVTGPSILAALNGTTNPAPYSSAADVAAALTNSNVASFAQTFGTYLTSVTSGTFTGSGTSYTISGLSAGYYLVKDKDNSQDDKNDAYTTFILEVVKNVTAATKTGLPTVEKKVKDINDSTDSASSGWQDSADHDIGDTVSYQITGTLPSNYSSYKSYKYIFTDTICAGLTVNTSNVTVSVGGTNITDQFTITSTLYNGSDDAYTDGNVLTISCSDLKAITTATINASSNIIVSYTATLNSNAKIGSAGNPNKVDLTFSNNPNVGGEDDTGKTPEDTVIVFTYKLTVDKVTENTTTNTLEALTGAGFTLYKLDSSNNIIKTFTELKGTDTKPMSTFTWTGVDDGIYKLVETTVPDGYNKMADIQFTVTATHDTTSDNPALTDLSGSITSGAVVTNTFAGNKTDGSVSFDVENKPGNTLPSTGGVGTTMFYVIGSVLVIGAFILLVAKKRANRTN